MRFEHPQILWLLPVALPGLIAFLWWAWRKKRRLIAQFVQSRLLAHLTVGVSTRRQKVRLGLLVAAVGLILLSLARPQWGFDFEEARQRGLDIVVAIDTSRSMLASDVSPNRLERAKLAALDLMNLARSDRLGLVAFSGGAFLQCPLTVDDAAFRQSLQALNTSIIPQGGTALAEAIRAAQGAFEKDRDNYKILVLFTDGEDHDGKALEAARRAAAEDMRIFTVGVGTPGGELISIQDANGEIQFLKDTDGQVVKSRLQEDLLKQLAETCQGFYLILSGANTIDLLYERGLAPLPKSEFAERQIKRFHERYQWFLALALLLLMIEMLLPERKRIPQPRSPAVGSFNQDLQRAVSALLLLALPLAVQASAGRALKHYQAGDYARALQEYQRLLQKKPDDPRLHYNAGSSAYQAEDFATAADHFQSALVTQDLALQQQAYYNLGNTQFRLGQSLSDLNEKQSAWQRALTHYESALKLQPEDQDASFNRDLVQQKLEELKQQQEQQQPKQENKDDESKDSQDPSDQNQSDSQDQNKDQEDQPSQDPPSKPDQPDQKPSEQEKAEENQPNSQEPQPGQQDQNSEEGQEKKDASAGESSEEPPPPDQPGQQPQSALRMTPQQAQRLLDAVKGEERSLIFLPPTLTNRNARSFKNW